MDADRRAFLRGGAACALSAVGAAWSLPLQAEIDPIEQALAATTLEQVLSLIGGAGTPSDKIVLTAPDLAENGAVVPVGVSSSLPGTSRIFIVVSTNPNPLIASFDIPENTDPQVQTRIKMDKTDTVAAIVQAGGKLYRTEKHTRVTRGGCGG